MRKIADFTLMALLAAFAAAGAVAASSDYLLTLPPAKGELAKGKTGEQVEVQSFHWGPRQTTSADGSRTSGHSMLGASDRTAAAHDVKPPRDSGLGSESERTLAVPHLLERGSLTLQGSLPGCAVGQRYAGAQFAAAGMRYELKDVVISNCAEGGLTLDYARVTVRGWDPQVKQH